MLPHRSPATFGVALCQAGPRVRPPPPPPGAVNPRATSEPAHPIASSPSGPSASRNDGDRHAAATGAESNGGVEEFASQSGAVAEDGGPKAAPMKGGHGCDWTDLLPAEAGRGSDVRSIDPVHIFVMGHRWVNRIAWTEMPGLRHRETGHRHAWLQWHCSVTDHHVL